MSATAAPIIGVWPHHPPCRTANPRADVPDCLIDGYAPRIETIELPDRDDRHVVAAAIECGAELIVTDNTADFPAEALRPVGIEAQTADDFVVDLIVRAPATVAATVSEQAAALANPPLTVDEVLDRLERSGLGQAVAELRRRGLHQTSTDVL